VTEWILAGRAQKSFELGNEPLRVNKLNEKRKHNLTLRRPLLGSRTNRILPAGGGPYVVSLPTIRSNW
jgi:hypothetical protein